MHHNNVLNTLTAYIVGGIRKCCAFLTALKSTTLPPLSFFQYCQSLPTNVNRLCGKIHLLQDTRINTTLHINPLSGYTTVIKFHRFNMLYSHKCEINMMLLRKIIPPRHEDRYCGAMPPWTEMCPCRKIHLQLVVDFLHPPTEFVMSYFMKIKQVLTTYALIRVLQKPGQWLNLKLENKYNLFQESLVFIRMKIWQMILLNMTDAG